MNLLSQSDLDIRFWERVEVDVASGCWLWKGWANWRGYGGFYIYGLFPTKRGKAHRYSYERYREAIPNGLTLDHLCRTRICVNPWHLEPVSNGENVLRGDGPAARNARATHCIHGHEFTPENTYINGNERACRTCRRSFDRKRRAARR